MSEKMKYIPKIPSYSYIRDEMREDLEYRLFNRKHKTSFGRPLYYRTNVQIIVTEECPYHCPFCLERKNPMNGHNNFPSQISSLFKVLDEHPNARLTITGGEPGLYPGHVNNICSVYKENSNNVFLSINTAGYFSEWNNGAHINLSVNDWVNPDPNDFKGCTVQTVLRDDEMRLKRLKEFMLKTPAESFSFRFLSDLKNHEYDVTIWNELRCDPEIHIGTFRIGDFFVYATFDWKGKHARVTLGDMYQQKHNNYKDGYSNIIIHPDGKIGLNWT